MKYFNQYGIASFPTFVIEIDGEIVELIDYNITLRQLENILNKYDPFEEAMYEEE
jgi:protein-disulfide isomerase-like protein with CxxC motif